DDPVEIRRIALGHDQGVAAAARAAEEIRVFEFLRVVSRDDLLRYFGGAMNRAMREVFPRLRVVERPARIDGGALVSGVGADGRVTALERGAAQHHVRALRGVLNAAAEDRAT